MKKNATAVWNGSGREGTGHLAVQSSSANKARVQYSYNSRVENPSGAGPEELMAAAHAGCFAMKLDFLLNESGFTVDEIETRCEITLDMEKVAITKSELHCRARIPDIHPIRFTELAEEAKMTCPVSMAYAGLDIIMEAELIPVTKTAFNVLPYTA